MLESAQVRAARAFLNWSQTKLSQESGVSLATIKRLEKDSSGTNFGNVKKVLAALEDAGIIFTQNGISIRDEALKRGPFKKPRD